MTQYHFIPTANRTRLATSTRQEQVEPEMRERESLERELHPIVRRDPPPPPSTIMTEDTPLLRREPPPNIDLDSEHAMYERM